VRKPARHNDQLVDPRAAILLKPFDDLRQLRPAPWRGCLDCIIACAEGIDETARINPAEDAEGLAACLLVRSTSTARAVVRLIRLDHVVEARMLTRSLFENAFYLYRLAVDGSAFADDEVFHHRALGKVIKATGREGSSRVREISNRSLQQHPKGKALKPGEGHFRRRDQGRLRFLQTLVFRRRPSFDHGA
jgi:hypothetical protein